MGDTVKKILIVSLLVIGSLLFSGCTQQSAKVEFENIELESSIVELASAKIEKNDLVWIYPENEDPKQVPKEINVKYLFHNIVDRTVNVDVTVYFYDENNLLLDMVKGQTINSLIEDSTEGMANNVRLRGDDAALVHHVKIVAEEI
jgi:hypothetical protein